MTKKYLVIGISRSNDFPRLLLENLEQSTWRETLSYRGIAELEHGS